MVITEFEELEAAAACLCVAPPAPILGGTTTEGNEPVSLLANVARATPLTIRPIVLLSNGVAVVSALDASRSSPVFCFFFLLGLLKRIFLNE